MKRKTVRKLKLYLRAALGYFLALACFFGAYLIYPDFILKLKDTDKVIGKITDTRIIKKASSGKYKLNSEVFGFKISLSDKTFHVYSPRQDYSIYRNTLTIGDTVTVYFKPVPVTKTDIEVFKIEKEGEIILDSARYTSRNRIGFWIALLGGLVSTAMQTLQIRKALMPKGLA